MKSVRIASTVKHIEEADQNIMLFTIQEILTEHRTMLITGILTDLPTYLQFKFYTKVDKETQSKLRDSSSICRTQKSILIDMPTS